MHLQALYSQSQRYGGAVAEDLYRRSICLPSSSSLSVDEQLYVLDQVRRAAGVPVLEDLAEVAVIA